jgi:hypothetical protein
MLSCPNSRRSLAALFGVVASVAGLALGGPAAPASQEPAGPPQCGASGTFAVSFLRTFDCSPAALTRAIGGNGRIERVEWKLCFVSEPHVRWGVFDGRPLLREIDRAGRRDRVVTLREVRKWRRQLGSDRAAGQEYERLVKRSFADTPCVPELA